MSNKTWTAGIVGCGKIAGAKDRPSRSGPVRTHAQAYLRQPGFRLAACVNPSAGSLRAFKKSWKVPNGYRSLAELLENERLDVVSLCSPSELHAAHIKEVFSSARKPKLLFVEKPVCLSEREQQELLQESERTGLKILVNHSRRFDPAHRQLRELIRSGKLGYLVQARAVYYGGWINNGVHLIDTLRMLLPQELTLVSSRPAGHGRGKDANLDLELRAGEAPVEIRAFDERHYQLFEMDLLFEQGRVRLLDAGFELRAEKVTVNRWEERELKPLPGFPKKGLISPLAEAMKAIGMILEGKARVSDWGTDLPSALRTMRFLWKAQQLAESPAQNEVAHAL